jgi:two-component system cell cycle sensor histidine kinase/response regulator CckA
MLIPYYWALAALGLLAAVVLAVCYRLRVNRLQRGIFNLMILVEQKGHGEARYRDLFENASDALFVTDLDGNLTELNRKAEALIGYDNATARTVNLRALLCVTPESERVVQRWLNGEADGSEQIEMLSRSGEPVPVEVSTRVIEEAGKAVGVQAIARDVRERQALERQLRQSQKMEAVGQLAGGVAHDFNNLLTVIRGNGALVLEELPEGDPIRHDVQQINEAADRASVLTRQLLAFSRKQLVQPRELDVNGLLHDLERMLQRLIGENFAIVTLVASEAAHVVADPGQLEQVVLNLVVNARDAMPDGGTITIETRLIALGDVPQTRIHSQSGRLVSLSVTDTGIGMSAATQARIFEPFFTTKEVGKGTGLGLSTVFGIVQQSNGQIICTSQPGRGTTFEIVLPYVASAAPRRVGTDELAAAPAGTESILLVEDEDEVRTLTARVLRRAGYEVIEARHGEDALGVAQDYPYHLDLVLSDIVLPGMNGLVLSRRLSMSRPTLRVLLMSGYTKDEIVRRGIGEFGIEYLQKPFTPYSLAVKVRAVLDAPASTCADQSPAVA